MLSQATTRTCMLFSVSGFSKGLLRVYGRRKCADTCSSVAETLGLLTATAHDDYPTAK